MVFTGIQGAESKYDLELTSEGLLVTDTYTGEQMKAVLVKKQKNSKEDRWRIKTPTSYYYFSQQAIRASHMRREMKERPVEESRKRNNVEATIFQLSYTLRNNKSKYRSLIKQKTWTFCRCLWINLVRIINFTKQTCQRTFVMAEKPCLLTFLTLLLTIWRRIIQKMIEFSYQLFFMMRFNFFFHKKSLCLNAPFRRGLNIKSISGLIHQSILIILTNHISNEALTFPAHQNII